jgi:hypothetical protein
MLQGEQQAADVGVENGVVRLRGLGRQRGRAAGVAGIVDGCVELAEDLDGGVDQGADVVLDGDVGAKVLGPATQPAELGPARHVAPRNRADHGRGRHAPPDRCPPSLRSRAPLEGECRGQNAARASCSPPGNIIQTSLSDHANQTDQSATVKRFVMFVSRTARCASHSSGGGRTLPLAARVLAVRTDNQAHADPDSPRLSNSGAAGLCCPHPPVTLFDETLDSGKSGGQPGALTQINEAS